MKRKVFSILAGLLMVVLVSSTAFATGGVKISGATFSLGSLIANGIVSGLGNTDVNVELVASGNAAITCTNNGGNAVPGQSSPKVSGKSTDPLLSTDVLRKNGKEPFTNESFPPSTVSWDVGGCPNSNWMAMVTFVYWTNAVITVYYRNSDGSDGPALASQSYLCNTTLTSVSCTATP